MTHDDPNLPQLEDDLWALAVAQPGDEHLRLRLRERLLPDPPVTKRRKPSFRFTLPALAGVAAAAAVAVIALIGATGSGGPGAADAAILHRTLAAVTAPPNTILHVKTIDVANGATFITEWWQQTSRPYANRGVKGPTGHLGEFANNGTTSYTYDPSTNTIYQHPDTGAPIFTDPISLIRQQLGNGQAHVTGKTTINGHPLYGIRLSSGITTYVDKGSYIPRYIDDPQSNGTTLRFKVVAYQYLAAIPQHRQLLSITAQHPDATIDTNPNDWPASISKVAEVAPARGRWHRPMSPRSHLQCRCLYGTASSCSALQSAALHFRCSCRVRGRSPRRRCTRRWRSSRWQDVLRVRPRLGLDPQTGIGVAA